MILSAKLSVVQGSGLTMKGFDHERAVQNGDLVILDWKRSAKSKKYEGQLNLYKYLLEENYTLDGEPILIERFHPNPRNPKPYFSLSLLTHPYPPSRSP